MYIITLRTKEENDQKVIIKIKVLFDGQGVSSFVAVL